MKALSRRWRGSPRREWTRLRTYLSGAPGTLVFLFTLTVTWWTLQGVDHRTLHRLIVSASTNLHNMSDQPIRVLVASAFWSDSTDFPWLVFVEFLVVMVAAERWLGTGRWVLVFAAGHVGATIVTVTGIAWALHHGLLPTKIAGTVDVGASYGFWAVAAVLSYRIPPRWRLWWIATIAAFLGYEAWTEQTFTDYGHLTAMLIGLGMYPITKRPNAIRQAWARRNRA